MPRREWSSTPASAPSGAGRPVPRIRPRTGNRPTDLRPQSSDGQNAKTLVKYDDLRIVLMVLKAQARVTDHKADGRISIQTLRGHIRMRARGRTFDPPAGSLLSLDRGLTHDVEALEDSALLLTVAWRGRDGS